MRRVIIGGGAIFTFVGGIYAMQTYQASSRRTPIATSVDGTNTVSLPTGEYGPYFTRQQSRAIFDREAATYQARVCVDEHVTGVKKLRNQLISQATGNVLEVAAGNGTNFEYYRHPQVSRVVAIDYSPAMLDQARREVTKRGNSPPSITLEVGDAHAMTSIPDRSFDTVIDTFGLCSFENPRAVLTEMQRVVKHDGRILLLEHGRSHWSLVNTLLGVDRRAAAHAARWGCHWNRDIDQIVKDSGLKIVTRNTAEFGTVTLIVAVPTTTTTAAPTPEQRTLNTTATNTTAAAIPSSKS